jgi:NAD(P)-dependent dehydrogenase (short-subunit alcohol dehydrogenase family)
LTRPERLPLPYEVPAGLLRDRVIFITGATGAIGAAVSLAAARAGARVIVCGRAVQRMNDLCDCIEQSGCAPPQAVALDLQGATLRDYEQLAECVGEAHGRLDGLVLNAAMLGTLAPLTHYDPMVWARVMQVNVHGNFLLMRTMLPLLSAAADASVVLTAADVGRRARAYWGAYAVSKFAVEGLAQVSAAELAGGPVRVNTLDPGPVRSPLRADAYPGEDPARLPAAERVAAAFLYLLGPDSRGVTGRAFYI